jgi:hypothetical protein
MGEWGRYRITCPRKREIRTRRLEQYPSLTGEKFGPIGEQAPAVFPSPAEDDGGHGMGRGT